VSDATAAASEAMAARTAAGAEAIVRDRYLAAVADDPVLVHGLSEQEAAGIIKD
jgi:hypothetical protein